MTSKPTAPKGAPEAREPTDDELLADIAQSQQATFAILSAVCVSLEQIVAKLETPRGPQSHEAAHFMTGMVFGVLCGLGGGWLAWVA